jgi:hypothetical protein
VVFFQAALLEQNAAVRIGQKNGESPVEQSRLVHGQFFPAPDRAVLLVHENQVLGHGLGSGG